FRERFAKSPIKRAKCAGLQRNVCVALGNIGDKAAVPALARTLRNSPDAVVRQHAAWALGRIGGPEAERALSEASGSEDDAGVVEEIRTAMGEVKAGV
ncbi:MAG: tRNA epoxyqueuosine(34) reductase QueG, partial [SAR202 cluster bacterium]|nr:tRNA epoxyqueuosine(34) reductase QueG [SAR202 cluster bacterium]